MLEFYSGLLRLPAEIDPNHSRLTIKVGESELTFAQEPTFAGCCHFAINIPRNRLPAAAAYLRSNGIRLLRDDSGKAEFEFSSWDAHAVYFRDPGGNVVELIARRELNNDFTDTAADFTALELLCISEIGIVSAEPAKVARGLTKIYGLIPYKDNGPEFIPVGDADGLLIVVKTGRIWYPTAEARAETNPRKVTVRIGSGQATDLTEVLSTDKRES